VPCEQLVKLSNHELALNLLDAVTKRLGCSRSGCVLGTKNNLNLIVCISMRPTSRSSPAGTHSHGLSINLDRVELLGSFRCALCLREDDGGDADTTAVLVVVKENLLDGSNTL
jgi:hypothetical protein